ncbi:MAG: alpha/beta hydrolase [Alphaproteobacteria bacterium]
MFFGHLADHLILFPTRAPLDTRGAVRKTVPFEDGEVEIWTAQSRKAQQQGHADLFILRFYGNADRADRWADMEAEMWNGRAVEIWGMNYPGFGGSTGPARLSKIGSAALSAFDELKRDAKRTRAVESAVPSGSSSGLALRTADSTAPIIVFGTSIGATAALRVAAARPDEISGVILQNPPPIREMILRQFGCWNLWLLAGPVALQIPPDLDSIANAKMSHARAIVLLAEKDEIVAPRFHRLVVSAYAGEKRVIALPGAHHNDPIEGAALTALNDTLGWLLESSPKSKY